MGHDRRRPVDVDGTRRGRNDDALGNGFEFIGLGLYHRYIDWLHRAARGFDVAPSGRRFVRLFVAFFCLIDSCGIHYTARIIGCLDLSDDFCFVDRSRHRLDVSAGICFNYACRHSARRILYAAGLVGSGFIQPELLAGISSAIAGRDPHPFDRSGQFDGEFDQLCRANHGRACGNGIGADCRFVALIEPVFADQL